MSKTIIFRVPDDLHEKVLSECAKGEDGKPKITEFMLNVLDDYFNPPENNDLKVVPIEPEQPTDFENWKVPKDLCVAIDSIKDAKTMTTQMYGISLLVSSVNYWSKRRATQPQTPYYDLKNESKEDFNQDAPESALLKSMGLKFPK